MKSLGILALSLLLLASTASASAQACLQDPSPSATVTSLYGWRFHPVLKMWRLHRGVDLRAPMMTPLVAAQSGTVQVAFSPSGGNELRIVGSDGTVTRYLHLTRVIVDPGSSVTAGQQVAISGNTGHASAAPHLHFELYPAGKGDTNPEPYLCPPPSRKAGAEMVDGFPIMACKPESGGSCNPNNASQSVALTPPAALPSNPGQQISQFDDMSTNEIFTSEVTKRFGNPDWYARIQERTAIPLIAEYVHMLALESEIDLEKNNSRARIEALLAVKLARDNKKEMEARLQRQRLATAKSGSQ